MRQSNNRLPQPNRRKSNAPAQQVFHLKIDVNDKNEHHSAKLDVVELLNFIKTFECSLEDIKSALTYRDLQRLEDLLVSM